jgi:hypothetical protein
LIGDAWRWRLHQEEEEKDLDKAWRQMIRWLAADVPQRVEVEVVPQQAGGQPMSKLEVRVRDPKFKPLDNAAVAVTIRPPGGELLKLDAEPAAGEAGLYVTSYVPREPGAFRAEVAVRDIAGQDVGQAEAGWVSDAAAEEFRSLRPNRELLKSLAEKTGGELVEADALEAFVRGLSGRKLPITEPTVYPLWHQPLLFLLALACLIGEWGLRRWKGLA